MAAPRKIGIELDGGGACAVHAALTSALAADPEQFAGARAVLAQLERRVPDWTPSDDPHDAVLGALATAEDAGRVALAHEELAVALGAGGASIGALLDRMEREKLVQRTSRDGRTWIAAALAGRRRHAARAAGEHEPLTGADALVDLLYAERRPSRWAYRPAVQAIARLDDAAFDLLTGELRRRRLLEPADGDDLTLTDDGAALARKRWAATSSLPHWRIPPPPLPYRPLPVRVEPEDRGCPAGGCDGEADWLKPKGRAAAFKALVRDGSVEWTCPSCSRTWLIYLQAYDDDGVPAYRDPAEGAYNRPRWRSGR